MNHPNCRSGGVKVQISQFFCFSSFPNGFYYNSRIYEKFFWFNKSKIVVNRYILEEIFRSFG